MEVQRERPQLMICVCRLVTVVRPNGMSAHDTCMMQTSGPDEPVCEFCIGARHPEQPNWDPQIKQVPEWMEVIHGDRTTRA